MVIIAARTAALLSGPHVYSDDLDSSTDRRSVFDEVGAAIISSNDRHSMEVPINA